MLLASPAQAVEPVHEAIHGVWVRGGHDDEKLEFYDCDGKLCAKDTNPPAQGAPPLVILRHATKTAPNIWKGDLFNPENGKTYSGTITLDKPNQLTLKGCLIAFLCQSETWTRAVSAAPDKAPAAGSDKAAPGSAKTAPGPAAKAVAPAKTAPKTPKAPPSAGETAPTAEPPR
jgi:hypothetical protein